MLAQVASRRTEESNDPRYLPYRRQCPLHRVRCHDLSEADASSIIDLAQRGWASTAIADSLERRRGYERLHDLVEYAAKRPQSESLEDPT